MAPTWIAFVQGLGGITMVGEAPTMDEALTLARSKQSDVGCTGAIRSDRKLPEVEPRAPSGSPTGGWRKANESRKARDLRRRGGQGNG